MPGIPNKGRLISYDSHADIVIIRLEHTNQLFTCQLHDCNLAVQSRIHQGDQVRGFDVFFNGDAQHHTASAVNLVLTKP